MCTSCTTYKQPTLTIYAREEKYDPTRTLTIRRKFSSDMKRRFGKLSKDITYAIVEQDCFGLRPAVYVGRKEFAFTRTTDKVNAFMDWLDGQVKSGILQTQSFNQLGSGAEKAWTNMYISDSYKRGVIRARYEMGKAGLDVPSMEETGGINTSMSNPFHIDRLGVLYSRVFKDLKGITDAMDNQISKVLTQGIADGDNPKLLARKLVKTINGGGTSDLGITDTLGRYIPAARRAELLARTEIIRAHHTATIQEYKNWQITGVTIRAEFATADDDRVCPQCASYHGKSFTIKEVENLIPIHPQCRCITLPEVLNKKQKEKEKKKPTGKDIDISLTAEEQEVLKTYTMSGYDYSYAYINDYLRGGKVIGKHTVEEMERRVGIIDSVLEKQKQPFEVLYRGTSYKEYGIENWKDIKPGMVLRDKAFTSTSKSFDIAKEGYAGNYPIMKIEDASGLDLKDIAYITNEQEVLLAHDLPFQVTSVEDGVINVKVISNEAAKEAAEKAAKEAAEKAAKEAAEKISPVPNKYTYTKHTKPTNDDEIQEVWQDFYDKYRIYLDDMSYGAKVETLVMDKINEVGESVGNHILSKYPKLAELFEDRRALLHVEVNVNLPRNIYGQYNTSRMLNSYNTLSISKQAMIRTTDTLTLGKGNVGLDFATTIRHEFGHHIYYKTLGRGVQNEWEKFFGVNKSLFKKVSKYASSEPDEAFAEAFAAYTSPLYKKGMMPKEIEGYMESLIGKKIDITKLTEGQKVAKELKIIPSADSMASCVIGGSVNVYKPSSCDDFVRVGTKESGYTWHRHGKAPDAETMERINKLRIPPGWTDVVVATDPHAKIQAMGMDAAGRWQYRYSAEWVEKQAQEKFKRVRDFAADMPSIMEGIQAGINNGDLEANLLRMDRLTSIRAGKAGETVAKKKAYGLTTLKKEHIHFINDEVAVLKFVAKEGLPQTYYIQDPQVIKFLMSRYNATRMGDNLFDTTAEKVNDYLKKLAGRPYTLKDFRTYNATRYARELLEKYAGNRYTAKEIEAIKDEVSTEVSRHLHNTPIMALNQYIDPMVWNVIQ